MNRYLRLLSYVLIVFALLTSSPSSAFCGSEKTTIRFAEEANWPPFTPDKFGIATEGLSFQLMEAIFSRLDMDVEIELFPQNRMLNYLETGQKDGATVISINKARREYLEFSKPLFAKRGYVYFSSTREHPVLWNQYSDLQGLVIGIVAGHNYGLEFNDAVQQYGLKTVPLSQERQGFDLLLINRIDCFLCINLTANHFLNMAKYSGKIEHAPKSYYQKDYHIAFSKKSQTRFLIPRLNQVISQMQDDGSLTEILAPFLR